MQNTKILIDQFLISLVERGYSVNTVKSYRHALKNLEDINVSTTTTVDLMLILSQNDWDRNTVSARQAAFKAFFKWLHKNNIIQYNPAAALANIKPKQTSSKPISFNEHKEILEVIKTLPIPPQVFFLTIINYGLKISEVLSIKITDIDWEREEIILQDKVLPFKENLEYKKLLKQLCKNNNFFSTIRNESPTYDWAYYWWKKTNLNYTISDLISMYKAHSA